MNISIKKEGATFETPSSILNQRGSLFQEIALKVFVLHPDLIGFQFLKGRISG
jgi:hypothetical protein